MGKNTRRCVHTGKLGRRSVQGLVGPPTRNEWREFVRETSTAKFYAIGFCVLCIGITSGIVTSLVLGSSEGLRLGNLMLASGGYSVLRKLKRRLLSTK